MAVSEFQALGKRLESALVLSKPIVAVTFTPDTARLRRSTDVVESSCVFWTKALESSFYTTPDQHLHCSVGAITHGYRSAKDSLPGAGLADIDLLTSVGWIGKSDILGLPSLPLEAQRNIGYSPLDSSPFVPDVVLLFVDSQQAALIREAAPESRITVKPTCQGLPLANEGDVVIGLGCTASRTRSGYQESEIVVTLNAKKLGTFVDRLETIAAIDHRVKAALTPAA
ncbi:MAG: DUF169 domain-containing protein [Thaumarchaeota archaeon]|nr:DUF169 domain-containing protein [Nitrososphaerota archaeon]